MNAPNTGCTCPPSAWVCSGILAEKWFLGFVALLQSAAGEPNRYQPKYLSDCVYPCPCGYYGDSQKPCTCAHAVVTKYQKRISGPLLDRIDIHIEVPRVDYEKLSGDRMGETSASIRQRVQAARNIQRSRFTDFQSPNHQITNHQSTDIVCNADMRLGEIRRFCRLQDEGQSLMRSAMTQLNLSARAYHRILKLARTIADLAGSEETQSVHLAEALQYRPKLMVA